MPAKSAGSVTRLAFYGGARKNYGSFAGKTGGGGAALIAQMRSYFRGVSMRVFGRVN